VPLPQSVDGNRRPARRLAHHSNAIVAALGRQPTGAEASQVVAAALLSVQIEELAAKSAGGQDISPETVARLSGSLERVLRRLGIGAGAKPTEEPKPDLKAYLDRKAAEKAAQGKQDAAA